MTFFIPTSIMISCCDISICIMISLSNNHNYWNSIFIVLVLTTKENIANNIRSAYTHMISPKTVLVAYWLAMILLITKIQWPEAIWSLCQITQNHIYVYTVDNQMHMYGLVYIGVKVTFISTMLLYQYCNSSELK